MSYKTRRVEHLNPTNHFSACTKLLLAIPVTQYHVQKKGEPHKLESHSSNKEQIQDAKMIRMLFLINTPFTTPMDMCSTMPPLKCYKTSNAIFVCSTCTLVTIPPTGYPRYLQSIPSVLEHCPLEPNILLFQLKPANNLHSACAKLHALAHNNTL